MLKSPEGKAIPKLKHELVLAELELTRGCDVRIFSGFPNPDQTNMPQIYELSDIPCTVDQEAVNELKSRLDFSSNEDMNVRCQTDLNTERLKYTSEPTHQKHFTELAVKYGHVRYSCPTIS